MTICFSKTFSWGWSAKVWESTEEKERVRCLEDQVILEEERNKKSRRRSQPTQLVVGSGFLTLKLKQSNMSWFIMYYCWNQTVNQVWSGDGDGDGDCLSFRSYITDRRENNKILRQRVIVVQIYFRSWTWEKVFGLYVCGISFFFRPFL